jgi:hypothetical protein
MTDKTGPFFITLYENSITNGISVNPAKTSINPAFDSHSLILLTALIICAQNFHNKWGNMSLRSREGEFDLTELAGVAGHKPSAGAVLAPEDALRFMRENLCFRYKSDLKNGEGPVIEPVLEIF